MLEIAGILFAQSGGEAGGNAGRFGTFVLDDGRFPFGRFFGGSFPGLFAGFIGGIHGFDQGLG